MHKSKSKAAGARLWGVMITLMTAGDVGGAGSAIRPFEREGDHNASSNRLADPDY